MKTIKHTDYFHQLPDWFCKELKNASWRTRRWFDVSWNSQGVKRRNATKDHWLLIIVCSGENQIIHQGKSLSLCEHEATILPPGHAHTQKTLSTKSLIARLPLVLLQEIATQAHPLRQFPLPVTIPLLNPGDAIQRVQQLMALENQRHMKSNADLLLGHMHTESLFYNTMAGAFTSSVFDQHPDEETDNIALIKNYMEEHYQDPGLHITKIARDFKISRTDLQKQFAARYLLPPKQWLHQYRISIAARLIRNHPELTIDAILTRCGYQSRSLFYSQFTQWKSCSPGEYRRNDLGVS